MRALLVALLLLVPVQAQISNPDNVVHTPATIEATLRDIESINPDFVTVDTFGQSLGGLPLWMVDIVHPNATDVPVFYLDANHHGNEQMGMEALLIWLREVAEWSLTEEGAKRLSEVRVVGAPMINPDGTQTDKRTNSGNVDLNRNYPFHWGLYGTADHPASLNYRGSSEASEPETQANVALMRELHPDVYLSMHTGSHDIVLPWRQTEDADGPMPDWMLYQVWLAGIKEVSGLDYRDPSGAGESISWGYGALGAPSLIVEVTTIQFEPTQQDDFEEILKEEVLIYWYTLDNLESLGGNLVLTGDRLESSGWGPAVNVTYKDSLGNVVAQYGDAEPGAILTIPAGATSVEWQRRYQATEMPPVWSMEIPASVQASVDESNDAPLPVAVLLVALVAVALRRR